METKGHSERFVCLGWQKTEQCCPHRYATALCKAYIASGCGSMSAVFMISDLCGCVNEICPVLGFYMVYNPKKAQVSCLKQCVYQSSLLVFWRIMKLDNGNGRRKHG